MVYWLKFKLKFQIFHSCFSLAITFRIYNNYFIRLCILILCAVRNFLLFIGEMCTTTRYSVPLGKMFFTCLFNLLLMGFLTSARIVECWMIGDIHSYQLHTCITFFCLFFLQWTIDVCESNEDANGSLHIFDSIITDFMREQKIPGGSIAVSYNGRVIHRQGNATCMLLKLKFKHLR